MVHNIKLYNGRYHHDDFVDATIETPFATFETDSEGLTYRSGVDKKAISGDSLSIAVTQTGVSVDGKDLKLSRLNNVQDGVKIITENHSARRDGGSGDTSTSYYHSPGSPLDPEQQTRFDEGMQNLWDGLGRMGGGFGFGTGAWPGMNTGGWGAGRRGGMNRKTTKSRTFTSGTSAQHGHVYQEGSDFSNISGNNGIMIGNIHTTTGGSASQPMTADQRADFRKLMDGVRKVTRGAASLAASVNGHNGQTGRRRGQGSRGGPTHTFGSVQTNYFGTNVHDADDGDDDDDDGWSYEDFDDDDDVLDTDEEDAPSQRPPVPTQKFKS
ncbi:uncharacterized protein MKK02DRAFT_41742 [Dioszegia hungarica]|uniref:Uncharacterized protein n=1 Tax=Dioszegia hungarica TaxID=4972 RepID=A0AA38HDZ3_9TREE|nr:uncharacterized protein MKK02DRAFT_41742 [Dioszegia hungarica]KAI9638721.1 hypothetical protein MKK02DRAFT_41742 [Dioszegia hungarica]